MGQREQNKMLPIQKSNTARGCGLQLAPVYCAVPSSTIVTVVSDAHLSGPRDETSAAFHSFLETLPDSCDHLLINGDLFEFWFTYSSVIPRSAFPTLAALAKLRQAGVRLTVFGGNHDQWGGGFWENELEAEYFAKPTEMSLAGWSAWVGHGHGIVELDRTGRWMHGLTAKPITARAFSLVHPDMAFWMVRLLSRQLARRHRGDAIIVRAAAAQAEFARRLLRDRETLDLVVLGHTHRHALESVGYNRWYLNPGAWVEQYRYAVITSDGPELRQYQA